MNKPLRVLVVEDGEQYSIQALDLLRGHNITFTNFHDAEGLLEKEQFDVVLTDRITQAMLPKCRAKTIFGLVMLSSWDAVQSADESLFISKGQI